MTKIEQIAEYLSKCTNGVSSGCAGGTGLRAICDRIFNDIKKNVPKSEMVKKISEFYKDEKNIIDVWKKLSECERDFVNYIVKYNGKEFIPATEKYAKKHKLKTKYEDSWINNEDILDDQYIYPHLKFLHILNMNFKDTNAVLLFPSGKDMPFFVLEALKKIIEPMKFEYEEYTPSKKDYIICRENRINDFVAIVHFAASEQLKAKPYTFDITKAKLAKLSETIGFEEVCDKNGKFCTPKETKRNNDFKVAPLLFALAANSSLLDITPEGNVSPGKKSSELLFLPKHKLSKKLFNDYMAENKIYELHYITYVTVYGGDHCIDWHKCRKPIIDLLKKCPVEKFIKFENLDKYARIFCSNFFRKLSNCSIMVKGYDFNDNYYSSEYTPNWNECESQIIRLILSFLSAIGMIDVAYTENTARIERADDYCIGISGFRITKLGAWILGMTDKYESVKNTIIQNDKGDLIVLPDYSVIISGLKCRIEHETYFSKFLTNVSVDENAAIYKLDFQSIIRAYNKNITPKKIKESLEKASCKQLPKSVIRSLDDWQMKVGRIKIRNLTVLETDSNLLLEEIKHIKGMDSIITSSLEHAVAIKENYLKKAKTLIEKNGWPVKI